MSHLFRRAGRRAVPTPTTVRPDLPGLLLRAVVVALLALATSAAPAWAADSDDGGRAGFGVVPARGDDVDERAFFAYTLTPGSVAYDRVAVVNYGPTPLRLRLVGLDASNATDGGFTLGATGERPRDLGGWIRLADPDGIVEVPGRGPRGPGSAVVPLSISVPTDASPGDHGGGVVAVLRTQGRNPQGQNIDLEQRVAARVYVTVDGPVRPGLRVSELDATYVAGWLPWQPGHVDAGYSVVNTGNVRLGVRSSVRTSGPLGLLAHDRAGAEAAELLPHNEQVQQVRVDSVWPLLRTTVTISARPMAAVGTAAPDLAPVSRSVTLWTVPPWLPALLLLALAGAAFWRHRRRHPRPRGAHAPAPRRAPRTTGRSAVDDGASREPVGAGR